MCLLVFNIIHVCCNAQFTVTDQRITHELDIDGDWKQP